MKNLIWISQAIFKISYYVYFTVNTLLIDFLKAAFNKYDDASEYNLKCNIFI